MIIGKNYQKGVWSQLASERKFLAPFNFMKQKVIKMGNVVQNMETGDFMDNKQIFLIIMNERLYKQGEITKEQRDKVLNEIKSKEYEKY